VANINADFDMNFVWFCCSLPHINIVYDTAHPRASDVYSIIVFPGVRRKVFLSCFFPLSFKFLPPMWMLTVEADSLAVEEDAHK